MRIERNYSSIEEWTVRNLIEDLVAAGAQEIRRGRHGISGEFRVMYLGGCALEILYERRQAGIRIFGEREESAQRLLASLERRIEEYNKEHCSPKRKL